MPSQPNDEFPKIKGGGSLILAWRVKGKRVLIIGGGFVAASRVVHALEADALVTVICQREEMCPEMELRVDRKEVEWKAGPFTEGDLEDVNMVLSEDNQGATSVYELCHARKIPVNVADVLSQCDFWFMSTHRDGPLQVAISSNGKAPRLAHRLRESLGKKFPEDTGLAMEKFGVLRKAVREFDPAPGSSPKRMGWLSRLADSWRIEDIAKITTELAHKLLPYYDSGEVPAYWELVSQSGSVVLVGAGPGDPALLTVGAVHAIQAADLVVADRLVSRAITDLATCEVRIAPTKTKTTSGRVQDTMNLWVLEGLREGRRVVRLKVGDPFLYGRAGEELQFFSSHGYQATAIPGISSALGAPTAALIPVTHRGLSNQVLISTGHGEGGSIVPFPPFLNSRTLILLMAVAKTEEIQAKLLELEYPKNLPCTFVESYSLPTERVITTSLKSLHETASINNLQPPAVLYIGHTANFKQSL
ncbi:uroporphyrin-III C-methyltransferase [Entomophthora muscae]|uniref:Uroporphyrin-III C-methyltransferase n=1 Tax=Entomophthora muscae TaxID=34485 RepID=A0ACC2SYC2_9FUNG|nr:uroporphyrin-III C-methyltransferase [Entomophthora muscae]